MKTLVIIGDLSFQEYEKRVREANTDYSNVTVGKVLDTSEKEIIDIEKMIDELSDIEDLSGLSSSSSEHSDESQSSKKKKSDYEPKAKRRRRQQQQQQKKQEDSDDISETDDDNEGKSIDPNEMRNKMVQHLEQMRLAKQKLKKSKEILSRKSILILSLSL